MDKSKSILSLSSDAAMDLLLTSDQYHNFELPEYLDFTDILKQVQNIIGDKSYNECIKHSPSEYDNVNFDILLNKDGKYAVRPIVLSNPFLYYFLTREIFGKTNWPIIQEHFEKCSIPNIISCALPVVPNKKEPFHKSTTILNWWSSMEQKAIELSLDYRYMFVSDITNCYGSINPQTIEWALARKGTSICVESNHQIANNIIGYLRDLQKGHNIGIPQGSTLFDMVAEIILSYSDLLLSEAIEKRGIKNYFILRYRDDYRIFSNDKDELETISYELQQVLESLNFRMNSSKTYISESIITDSIKHDKLFYIFNTPIFNKKGCDFDGLQKHLLYMLMFSRKFPNCGQLRVMFNDFDKRVQEKLMSRTVSKTVLNIETKKLEKSDVIVDGKICENIKAMVAILTQIAIENISLSHYALRTISIMVSSLKNEILQEELITKVCDRLKNLPNSTYTKLWLQNITYSRDMRTKICPYNVRLCQIVMGKKEKLWNNEWLKTELIKGFKDSTIVNKKVLKEITPVITFRETRQYDEPY